MTEVELEALRDSLASLNDELDTLDSRVTALENLAVPKGDYFNQLKASFEGSPECCECETESNGCDCTNAENVAYFFNDSDSLTFQNASFEINGTTYTLEELSDIPDVLEITGWPIYVFDSVTEGYLDTIHYMQIKSNSMENLCVKITNTRDGYGNPAPALVALAIPPCNHTPERVYKVSDDINSDDFTYTYNGSIVNPVKSTDDLSIATFCLRPNT